MLSRFVQISFLFSIFFPEDEVLDQQFKLRQRSVGGLILKIFQSSLKLFFSRSQHNSASKILSSPPLTYALSPTPLFFFFLNKKTS